MLDLMMNKIKVLEPRESVVYYTGSIEKDICMTLSHESRQRLKLLRDTAYSLFVSGDVELLQRKIGDNTYEYIAIGRVINRRHDAQQNNILRFDRARGL